MDSHEITPTDIAAFKVVDLTKALLMADNHFLSTAIGRLRPIPGSYECAFSTNGSQLGIDSELVCMNYKLEREAPKRDLLHVVMHCIFLHPYVSADLEHDYWNLACDIAAERNVALICGPRPGSRGRRIEEVCRKVEANLKGQATAERIFKALNRGRWAEYVPEWLELFCVDDHEPWYKENSSQGNEGDGSDQRENDQPDEGETPPPAGSDESDGDDQEQEGENPNPQSGPDNEDDQPQQLPQGGQGAGQNESPEGLGDAPVPAPRGGDGDSSKGDDGSGPSPDQGLGPGQGNKAGEERSSVRRRGQGAQLQQVAGESLEKDVAAWRRIAKALSVNLQSGTVGKSEHWGNLVDEIEQTLNERVDYRSFLRQFAAAGEVMKVSQEEFDYVFYSYGLELYGNLPLIEPLEYRDEKRVREFVIVIDTSGSVEGDAVRRFVETTFDILKSAESFHQKVCIHIIQCDAEVQSDDVITSMDELAQWGSTMEIRGLGGTDFRPAFEYVEKLIADGEFEDLGGLVYFTDGWGTYPEKAPSYKTAFAFYDENYRAQMVPPWAAQVVLDEESMGSAASLGMKGK